MKKLLLAAVALLLAVPAFAPISAKAEEFTDSQKAEIKKMFDEYLANSGEIILQSVNSYQEKQSQQQQAEADKKASEFIGTLGESKDLAIAGNPKGDITLVEFFDYNCGYCKRALDELQIVLKDDKDLKVVFMDMPILGPSSAVAAKWSLAAKKQDKYFEYHQALLGHNGEKDEKSLEKLAKDVGLDIKKLKKDLESEEIAKTLDDNLAAAQGLNIRGTPGFVIAGKIYPGFMQADQIKEILKEARSQK